jgi:serine protease Do
MNLLFKRLRSRRLASVFILLATVSAAVLVGSYAAHGVRGQETQNTSTDATPLKVVTTPTPPNDFVRIAKLVGPAVVNINTQTLPKQSDKGGRRNFHQFRSQPNQQNPGDDDQDNGQQGQDNFQDFFNRFFGGQAPGPDEGADNGEVQESLGSGFIVDAKGYIITNDHVIDKADKIYVKLSTDPDTQDLGRPARVIGIDKATDLAVIKIDTSTPLPTVKLGNSDTAQVGDWVEAIGSPFALAQTVTAGIISAKNRTIDQGAPGQFQHFIQTDAAINPGNSGGPLLNMNGEVIGVNTAIYTQSAGYQGIGFAMPSNTVADVYNDLISPSHKVTRGSIGIQFREGLSGAVNRVYGFKNGVLVQEVQPGGPADKAGLKAGDIIVAVDGRPIKDGDDLVNDAVFANLNNPQPEGPDNSVIGAGEAKLGIVVQDTPPATVSRIHASGVIVESVRTGSFADLQGLEPGLVITHINRQPTPNKEQFDTVVSKLKTGDDVVFEVIDPHHPEQGINYIGGTL